MTNKLPKHKSIVVPLIVACALFMENLDSSIINTALPVIAKSLNTDPTNMSLAITAYLLSLATFLPASGWIADRFGTRSVFRLAIGLFTLSSIGCGFSQNLAQLVTFRILQGIGGSMMVPVGRLVLLKSSPKSELVDALAWMAIPALIGPVIAPLIGGFIVTYFPWGWIFFVNVPIGLLGMTLATIFIKDFREPNPAPFDVRGFMLMGMALCGIIFGLQIMGRGNASANLTACLLAAGTISAALYALHFKRSKSPIVNFRVFKTPTFFAGIFGGSFFRTSSGAMTFLIPMMLQVGFGISPLRSGMITFASAAGAFVMKFVVKPIIRAFGFKQALTVNAVICGLSVIVCGFFTPDTPHMTILIILLLGGFVRSLQYTSLNGLAFADIQHQNMSQATTVSTMFQQLTISVGVALGAIALDITTSVRGHAELMSEDFLPAVVFVGCLSLLSTLFFFPLPKNAGAEVSGHMWKKPIEDSEL